MMICKLTIKFDRGVKSNRAGDVGLVREPIETEAGGVIRGLGTHYVSQEAKERAEELEAEERRIRKAFAQTFVASPIPGTYVVSDLYDGEKLLRSLSIDSRVGARAATYDLTPQGRMVASEMADWVKRIRNQLEGAPLGRAEDAGAEGLRVLERLAGCPMLDEQTRSHLRGMVEDARLGKVKRVDFKRKIEALPINIDLKAVRALPARKVRRATLEKPSASPAGVGA